MKQRCVGRMLAAVAMALAMHMAYAQSYASKPIRLVTSAPGGSIDFVARLIAPGLTESLGQPVVIDNRGGAGGIIAVDTVAKAAPDGYTLLVYSNGMWTLQLITNVPYDSLKDFAPITEAAAAPAILVVHPSLPAHSLKELIALANARPGQLNYGGGGAGSQNFMAAELFKSMAGGLKIVNVPFKGGGPAVVALLAGDVQMMFASAPSVAAHIKSRRLRALAITSVQPSALFPGISTMAASGLPGYDVVSLFGIFAPARTPVTIIAKLHQEIVHALASREVKQGLAAGGMDVVGGSPEQLSAKMRLEIATMGKVFRAAGIRPN